MGTWPPNASLPDPVVDASLGARSRFTPAYNETLHKWQNALPRRERYRQRSPRFCDR